MPFPLANSQAQICVTASAQSSDRARSASRLLGVPAPLALWHLASLDAPTVAVVWSLAFAWTAGVHLAPWVPPLLALAAWSVYIGDRLLDAHTGLRLDAPDTLRERHVFHWRYRRVLLPLAVAAAGAAGALILVYLPRTARMPNSMLAAAALAYFSGVHSRRRFPALVSKEFLVGAIFTAGCALPIWSRLHAQPHAASVLWTFWVPTAFFAALAWLNCHAIGQWESRTLLPETHGPETHGVLARGGLLCLLGLALMLAAGMSHPRAAALLATGACSALLLALLDVLRKRLSPLALRVFADLVLLAPVALLPAMRHLA